MENFRANARSSGDRPSPELVRRWREQAQEDVLSEWKERLAAPTAGHWTAAAIGPILEDYYLHKVARREPTPVCHQCGSSTDTAQHTIELCPAWDEQRNALAAYTGQDFSLTNLVKVMIGSEAGWKAVDTFCEQVISQKEAAERVRETDALADPIRRRRVGRRRTRYAGQMPP
ncbi:uncharacterized protein LOC124636683 [Helicoverpa zea]|uniref:uncharacterized protein LOC124636683 n=1 Tax=Helicoverpa zea TaxID=7113 RepID=UPI001F58E713|nr:uncharacterized protein LOC124636683 [Helicoverpa zea]